MKSAMRLAVCFVVLAVSSSATASQDCRRRCTDNYGKLNQTCYNSCVALEKAEVAKKKMQEAARKAAEKAKTTAKDVRKGTKRN